MPRYATVRLDANRQRYALGLRRRHALPERRRRSLKAANPEYRVYEVRAPVTLVRGDAPPWRQT
jgi:hypothetical protein